MSDRKSDLQGAMQEALINGVVIGALVAGSMILSNNFSNIVVIRTTVAAMMLRFATYMITNSEKVEAGPISNYFGLTPQPKKKHWSTNLGKVI